VLAGAPDVVAGGVAARLFSAAPVVVVASPGSPADLAAAARSALRAHAPLLLLTSAPPRGTAPGGAAAPAARAAARKVSSRPASLAAVVSTALRAQIRALDPRAVLAAGVARDALAAQLPGIRVVTGPAMLPATTAPPPLGHLALLVRSGDSDAGTLAAVTTARVAGARVITVRGTDPRAARLSMIRDEHELDTRYQDLAILIHMDGQGTPADKEQTWQAVSPRPARAAGRRSCPARRTTRRNPARRPARQRGTRWSSRWDAAASRAGSSPGITRCNHRALSRVTRARTHPP